jgi:transcriptional regulator with XRE-family HTH domain
MDLLLENYSTIIERIRKDRNISREDLCDNVMSNRTYQRFVSGETSISSEKVFKLIDNLGIDIYSIHNIHKKLTDNEYNKLINGFNLVSQWKFSEAELIYASIDANAIASKTNKNIYTLTNLLIKRHNKKINKSDFYSKIEEIIGFPQVLNKKILNILEINSLFILSKKYILKNDSSIIDFFIELVKNYKENRYWLVDEYMSLIFTYITRGIYHFERYEKCIEFCNSGIDYCRSTGIYVGFENLLGYKSLSLNKLGEFEAALDVAKSLYMLLTINNHKLKKDQYLNVILESLKIEIDDIITIKKEE